VPRAGEARFLQSEAKNYQRGRNEAQRLERETQRKRRIGKEGAAGEVLRPQKALAQDDKMSLLLLGTKPEFHEQLGFWRFTTPSDLGDMSG
jgi:hypothetical protein